jgi:dipeptide/tripeptide permease
MEQTAKKGRPFGFYICALGFTFERMAFYTVKYLLAIWLATDVAKGGLGSDSVAGATMSAQFVAWTYITPMIGGYIADHFISPRLCVTIGMILMGIGYLVAWKATGTGLVWVMIILVSIGTGFFKGNLSGVNALLFDDPDELNAAFSIQYSFVNIGSFIGTTFIAVMAIGDNPTMSFQGVFGLCGCLLFFDALLFVFGGRKALGDAGKAPFKKDQREFVSEEKRAAASAPLTSGDKKRIVVIVIVTIFSAFFWMVWYMAYMPAYYTFGWGDGSDFLNIADWHLFGKLIPTSYFDSMNALVCIILGPVMAVVWNKLAAKGKDPSMFKKTGIGTILIGLSYVVMVIAYIQAGGQKEGTSCLWIFLVSLLMSVGEMIFSPLGNSFINKLAPAKVLGLLLGFWPVAVFIAQQLYPRVFAVLQAGPFVKGYGITAAITIIVGVLMCIFSGKLDNMEKTE